MKAVLVFLVALVAVASAGYLGAPAGVVAPAAYVAPAAPAIAAPAYVGAPVLAARPVLAGYGGVAYAGKAKIYG